MSSKMAAHELSFGKLYSPFLENKRIKTQRTSKELERITRGVSNHNRIEILFLLTKHAGITADQIAGLLNCNIKTVSGHTQKLAHAGLIDKKYLAQNVQHSLTPRGKKFVEFLRTL